MTKRIPLHGGLPEYMRLDCMQAGAVRARRWYGHMLLALGDGDIVLAVAQLLEHAFGGWQPPALIQDLRRAE
jgi:hypothetical protein